MAEKNKDKKRVKGKAAKSASDDKKANRNKPGKKSGDKKADNNKAAKKNKPSARVAKLMERFKDARPSDVSDKVFVAISPVHGKGLFAAKRIKANTVLGRLHGMPTTDDGIYVLWISDEIGLELTNDFRFINHNSDPNAAYSDMDVMALRDIEPGEELLHDYGW